MHWEILILLIVWAYIFRPKSIHIDFRGNDDDEPKKPKQIKSGRQRKQLKK
jgi:hypothetical protein